MTTCILIPEVLVQIIEILTIAVTIIQVSKDWNDHYPLSGTWLNFKNLPPMVLARRSSPVFLRGDINVLNLPMTSLI